MANALFDKGRESFLGGDSDWDAHNIKLVFVDHGVDTPVPSTDSFLSDIAGGSRVALSGNFANKTKLSGVADADDVVVAAVTGAQFESINIYNDTPAAESGKWLLAFIDTATGLPCTPNGGNITVQWDNAANKIFKL